MGMFGGRKRKLKLSIAGSIFQMISEDGKMPVAAIPPLPT
jgi:hypothetical protein